MCTYIYFGCPRLPMVAPASTLLVDILGHFVRYLVIVGGGQSQSFDGPSLVARG